MTKITKQELNQIIKEEVRKQTSRTRRKLNESTDKEYDELVSNFYKTLSNFENLFKKMKDNLDIPQELPINDDEYHNFYDSWSKQYRAIGDARHEYINAENIFDDIYEYVNKRHYEK